MCSFLLFFLSFSIVTPLTAVNESMGTIIILHSHHYYCRRLDRTFEASWNPHGKEPCDAQLVL